MTNFNTEDPIAFFNFNNIDFYTIGEIYSTNFEKYCEFNPNDDSVILHSKLIKQHADFKNYEILQEKLNAEQINKREYEESIRKLNIKIIAEIRSRFEQAILCTVKSRKTLSAHVDTLLFVSLCVYNTYWDADETSFNGLIALNRVSDLTFNQQPHYYRVYNQAKDICGLLYDYYKNQAPPYEVNLVINKRPHVIQDPMLTNWIMQLLLENIKAGGLPIGLDYMGGSITRLLKQRDKITNDDFLKQLEFIKESKPPNYKDVKRKVVRDFCLEIHKAFTFYMNLELDSFNGKRTKIYHNILKAFSMEDFEDTMRNFEKNEYKSPRVDIGEVRLYSLLTDDRI